MINLQKVENVASDFDGNEHRHCLQVREISASECISCLLWLDCLKIQYRWKIMTGCCVIVLNKANFLWFLQCLKYGLSCSSKFAELLGAIVRVRLPKFTDLTMGQKPSGTKFCEIKREE